MGALAIVGAAVDDRASRVDGVQPLDGEEIGVAIVLAIVQVTLQGPDRLPSAAECPVQHRERLGEARVGRPLAVRLLQDRAGAAEIVNAQQRVAEPLIDLREVGALDQRGLPRAGGLLVLARRRERRGQERQRRGAVDVGIDRALEAQFGLREVAGREKGDALIERRLDAGRHALAERRQRRLVDRRVALKGRLHRGVVDREEELRIDRDVPEPFS